MRTVPLTLKAANAYVAEHHRHHKPVVGHRFSLGLRKDSGDLCGVAIVGRPVARGFDPDTVCEVTRLCTDGTPNACSQLYGAARRVAKAMGFEKIITYTLASESGASLRASGWVAEATVTGRSWDAPSRPRVDKHPTEDKVRWAA